MSKIRSLCPRLLVCVQRSRSVSKAAGLCPRFLRCSKPLVCICSRFVFKMFFKEYVLCPWSVFKIFLQGLFSICFSRNTSYILGLCPRFKYHGSFLLCLCLMSQSQVCDPDFFSWSVLWVSSSILSLLVCVMGLWSRSVTPVMFHMSVSLVVTVVC